MKKSVSRRRVLGVFGAAVAGLLARRKGHAAPAPQAVRAPAVAVRGARPAVVASGNAHPHAVERTLELLGAGADTLDAAVAGVNLLEDDPGEMGVGLGGLPNEEGVVQLDASVMHGPTHEAGAVAALEDVRNPASVALKVCWETDHVLLVGEGAKRFARAHGFVEEDLLTEASRKRWLRWRTRHSDQDDWLEPEVKRPSGDGEGDGARQQGTVHVSACNAKGEVSGVTSTSGRAWKIPGRVGDSPIPGAGLYVRGDVGAAGSTGRGEAVIIAGGTFAVVEALARGLHPTDACLEAVDRVIAMNRKPYLLREDGTPRFQVNLYAVDVRGRVGGASIRPASMAAGGRDGSRRIDMAWRHPR